jgi:glyoxylase I family protein
VQTPGLSHIVMTVSDLARSRQFYADVLGFEIKDVRFEGGSMFYFTVGGVSIWFTEHPQVAPDDHFTEFRVGLDHLAFKATNEHELQAMADKLIAAGVNTKGLETFMTGNKYIAFRDPDNIQLEYWLD